VITAPCGPTSFHHRPAAGCLRIDAYVLATGVGVMLLGTWPAKSVSCPSIDRPWLRLAGPDILQDNPSRIAFRTGVVVLGYRAAFCGFACLGLGLACW
jgi:hypothetical protein